MHSILIAGAFHAEIAATGSRLIAMFSGFARTAAPVALDAVWQGAMVAVALVLCLRLAPRVSATHRFAIWASAFAVVATLPFLPIILHSLASAAVGPSALPTMAARPWLRFELDSRWGFIVAGLWLAASAFRAGDLIFHSMRLRQLWKTATPVPVDAGLRSLLVAVFPTRRSIWSRPIWSRPIEICKTRELDRPSVIGFFAPRILIPDWLFERLTPGELEHVALHEAEHLRRRDDWTNLLQKISLVLFPLNPALAWMEHRLCREREMACDEGVVRRTQAPRAYAACLTSLAERSLKRRAQALSLGAFGRRPELVHRVHSILWRKRALHPLAARAWVGAVGCGLLFGAVALARCPQVVAFVPAKTSDAAHQLANAQKASTTSDVVRDATSLASQPSMASTSTNTPAAAKLPAPSQFQATETKAILPARRNAAAPLMADSEGPASQQSIGTEERAVASLERNANSPRQVLLKAEDPNAAAIAQETGCIVFTAWEQVRTVRRGSAPVADYDADGGSQREYAQAAGDSDSQPGAQITITRVILTVYPAAQALQANRKHIAGSHSGLPAAIPFDGGWLVFRL